jgi:16S rRNA (uracil1498-N3)-methyltransferase
MRITDTELTHQIRKVLRLHEEEECVLFNGAGQEARVKIISFDEGGVLVTVVQVAQRDEDANRVVLYCAVLKRENFETVVQKATELGVSEIIPIITHRTIKTGLKRARLEKIATEASEQCGRVRVPTINEPILFTDALQKAQDYELTVILHTHDKNEDKIENRLYKSVALFVGPEGGFTDEEIMEAKKYNYTIHTFFGTVLRAETAAMVGVFWVKEVISG